MQTKLHRLAALAGLLTALILLVNAGRRTGVLPDAALVYAVAPLAETAGLIAITGFYFWQPAGFGRIGLLGYGLNFVGMAGLVGSEFVLNLIFPNLPSAQVTALLDGLTGTVFKIVSIVFLVGVLLFGAAMLRVGRLPRAGVALYVLGCVPIGLRGVLPAATLNPGLLVLAAAVTWLSIAILRNPHGAGTGAGTSGNQAVGSGAVAQNSSVVKPAV